MSFEATADFAETADEECAVHFYGSDCAQVRLIRPYVSHQLRLGMQTRFELHLNSCEGCSRAVEFELRVKQAVADFAKFAHFSRAWH